MEDTLENIFIDISLDSEDMIDWNEVEEFDSIKLLVNLETTSTTVEDSNVHVVIRIMHWQYIFKDIFGYQEEDLPLLLLSLLEEDNPAEVLARIPSLLMERGESSLFLKLRGATSRVFNCHLTFMSQPTVRHDEEELKEGFIKHAISVVTIRRAVGEGENLRLL